MVGLHIDERGTGPDVVLLHGMPTPPDELATFAAALEGYRVLVPHLPGYGRTAAALGRQGAAAIQELLIEALAARNVQTPTLIGYSMGAYRALSLATRLRARSVLALAGFVSLSAGERAGMRGFADALVAGVDVRDMLPPRFLSSSHREAHPNDDAIVRAWPECVATPVLVEELSDLATGASIAERVASFDGLVIARTGEMDVAVPPHHARAIVECAKDGRLEIVPGAGHALFVEDPEGTLDAVRRAAL